MSRQRAFDKITLLGVDVDTMSLSSAINYICAAAANPNQPAGYIIKPYVEFLDRAYRDETVTHLLNNAELSIADGVALQWAAAYLYAGPRTGLRLFKTLAEIVLDPGELAWPITERAAGTNFTWPLLNAAATHNLKVFLIGKETDAEIAAVAQLIQSRLSTITMVGTQNGRDQASQRGAVGETWLSATAARLAAAQPDLILVGMGFPLQEHVCAELAGRLPHGIFIGEGGTFDYDSFGGQRRKAPAALQNAGLEWLWRLFLEPKRLVRQLAIPRFIYRVWKSR